MLAKYRKYASHILKGGGEGGELAKPPPGGYDLKPMDEKHNSLSAAMQDNMDQRAEAAEMQEQINKQAGGGDPNDVEPGKTPPGTVEVEGSTVLDPEQNNTLTGIRELEMQASADTANDGAAKKGGGRRRKRKKRKKKTKRKRWPPKRKSRRSKKRKGGEGKVISSDGNKNWRRYKNLHQIGHAINPTTPAINKKMQIAQRKFKQKEMEAAYLKKMLGPSYEPTMTLHTHGGKRKKRTRKNLVDKLFRLAGGKRKRKKTKRKRR